MRLCEETASRLPADVARPGYDRAEQATGIVHFGIGAFHRAHQAWYTDLAMSGGGRDWMIAGVSLRSAGIANQMNPQHGLYTVSERSAAGAEVRVVGSVREVLVAGNDAAAVIDRLAAPQTAIASLTVTEKGYCRAPDGSLDLALAAEWSFYPLLAEALRRRQDAGRPGLTLLSCDNLADNGRQLETLVSAYLEAEAPDLTDWFARHCTCPSTMVDRIVPASTDANHTQLADRIGMDDEAAVFTEPFSQWVVEDRFAGPRPAWETVGAQLVSDVAPYETAKLRMLNGAHSALAYLGLARGHAYVHEAIADPAIRPLVDALMRREAAPTIAAAPGQDLGAYADDLIARFANPALEHKLIQIAMDGSQKVPQRWLATLAANRDAGRDCPAILTALGAWLCHVRGDSAVTWGPVDDPMAHDLARVWQAAGSSGVAQALFGERGLMASGWEPTSADLEAINRGIADAAA